VLSSGALFGTTVVTSVLGFGYWSLVARSAPAASVGAASAMVSALTLRVSSPWPTVSIRG
jgi:hypothetical protein